MAGQVAESMGQLLEVVAAFEEALDPAAARAGEAELAPVLAAALEPLLDMCERSAEALSVDHPSRCGGGRSLPCVYCRVAGCCTLGKRDAHISRCRVQTLVAGSAVSLAMPVYLSNSGLPWAEPIWSGTLYSHRVMSLTARGT